MNYDQSRTMCVAPSIARLIVCKATSVVLLLTLETRSDLTLTKLIAAKIPLCIY